MKKNNNSKKIFNWQWERDYINRYALIGLINTVLGFIVIFIFMLLGFSPIISNFAGYTAGLFLGFFLSKNFVFVSNGHFIAEGFRFFIAFIISFLFNLFVLYLCLTYFSLWEGIAQVVAAISYSLLMYFLSRFFVFNTSNRTKIPYCRIFDI